MTKRRSVCAAQNDLAGQLPILMALSAADIEMVTSIAVRIKRKMNGRNRFLMVLP